MNKKHMSKKRVFQLLTILLLVIGCLWNTELVLANSITKMNSSNYKPNNFELELMNDTLIFRDIPDAFEGGKLWIRLYSEKQEKEVYKEIFNTTSGVIIIPLSSYEDGAYRVYIYYNNNPNVSYYNGYWWDAGAPKIIKNGGEYSFNFGEYYNEVLDIHNSLPTFDYVLEYYKKPSYWIESEDETIIAKAKEITKDAKTDYEKVQAVYEWVIDNIYYDYVGLYDRSKLSVDAVTVLKTKKTVCQGYADLTAAFLRSLGIPTMVTGGHGGSPINKEDHNHAWNMVYVDGRWVFLDSTWDSRNRYENGEYKKNDPNLNRMWFDMSVELIATSHYILDDVYSEVLHDQLDSDEEKVIDVTYGDVKVPLKSLELPDGYELVYSVDNENKKYAYISNGYLVVKGSNPQDEVYVNYSIKKNGVVDEDQGSHIYYEIVNNCYMSSRTLMKETLSKGMTYDLQYELMEDVESNVKFKVTYTTSNSKVATVSKKGIIKAKAKGKATIKAVVKVGTKSFTYKQQVVVK